jgi:serine protease Do
MNPHLGGVGSMGRSLSYIAGGVTLLVVGLVLGVVITTSTNLAPTSVAQDAGSSVSSGSSVASLAVGRSPFAAVADEVLPAVVSVDTKRTVRRSADPFGDMFREFFGEPRRRQNEEENYREYEVPGSGSGFIFDEAGYVMTNNHVVRGATEIEVTLWDGREFEATIVGQDPNTDIAVIKIEDGDLPVLRLGDSDKIRVGDWAIAVGNPLELEGTVTVGVVSAKGRVDLNIQGGAPLYQDFIQTDASINFGNSGGPLVNIEGEVIGINSAINAQANGIGFAIPINLAKEVSDALIAEGKVVRGFLGVRPQEITRELAEAYDLGGTEGVLIAGVEDGTPAAEAGIEAGDVITEFDGTEITSVAQFRRVVAGVAPGEEVSVEVVRDGRTRDLSAVLTERSDTFVAAEEEEDEEETRWFGLEVVELDDPTISDLEIPAEDGVFVIDVESGSPADDGGIVPGDVIRKIGDRTVEDLDDYREVMRGLEGREKAISVMIQRGEYTQFVAIKPE